MTGRIPPDLLFGTQYMDLEEIVDHTAGLAARSSLAKIVVLWTVLSQVSWYTGLASRIIRIACLEVSEI